MDALRTSDKPFAVWTGTGTDLIFNRGIDLPGFASFPLLENVGMRQVLKNQMRDLVGLAQEAGVGCIVDTPTWMANRDRGGALGYDPKQLEELNNSAVALMRELRDEAGAQDVLISACIGPSRDPYSSDPPIRVEAAHDYHQAQIDTVAKAGADLATAYTFNRAEEAAGVVRAARQAGLPVLVALVVETDGCLDNGQTLDDAIAQIDALTDGYAEFFMVNCAHPTHFAPVLTGNSRLRGIVVNASRCSHAELDEAKELDEGAPEELGREVGELFRRFEGFKIFGGCCGTDMRHLRAMAREISAQ